MCVCLCEGEREIWNQFRFHFDFDLQSKLSMHVCRKQTPQQASTRQTDSKQAYRYQDHLDYSSSFQN